MSCLSRSRKKQQHGFFLKVFPSGSTTSNIFGGSPSATRSKFVPRYRSLRENLFVGITVSVRGKGLSWWYMVRVRVMGHGLWDRRTRVRTVVRIILAVLLLHSR